MGTTLSADEARRAALRAQGLLGAADRRSGVPGVLRKLGAVQLDTISVLARSQELVPFARLGPIGRDAVHSAYWSHEPGAARTFEYWSHAACVLPVEEWPMMALRRRKHRGRGGVWGNEVVSEAALAEIPRRLAAEGPLTTNPRSPTAARRCHPRSARPLPGAAPPANRPAYRYLPSKPGCADPPRCGYRRH